MQPDTGGRKVLVEGRYWWKEGTGGRKVGTGGRKVLVEGRYLWKEGTLLMLSRSERSCVFVHKGI